MLLHGPLGPALSFLVGAPASADATAATVVSITRHAPAPCTLQCGSGIGFVGGLVHRWRTDVAEALHVTRQYPRLIEARRRCCALACNCRCATRLTGPPPPRKFALLQHHVRLYESGRELRKQSFEEWSRDLHRSPRKQGALRVWAACCVVRCSALLSICRRPTCLHTSLQASPSAPSTLRPRRWAASRRSRRRRWWRHMPARGRRPTAPCEHGCSRGKLRNHQLVWPPASADACT